MKDFPPHIHTESICISKKLNKRNRKKHDLIIIY